MTDYDLEMMLQQTLSPRAPGESLNQNILHQMEVSQMNQNLFAMNRFKKVALLVAACFVLLTGTCLAAQNGLFTSIVGTTNSAAEYMDFADLDKAEKDFGANIMAVESFFNGYRFTGMDVTTNYLMDNSNNTTGEYPELSLSYANEDGAHLELSAVKEENVYNEERTDTAQKTVGDITLHYNMDTYKFVPENYELTDEDKQRQANDDHYFISIDATQVEETHFSFVTFVKDGIYYSLMSMNGESADTMFAMAEELLAA